MACIRKRGERWVVDFRDQEGRRHMLFRRTWKEAKAELTDVSHDVKRGTYCAPKEIPTIRELAGAWLANKADRCPATVAGWENHVYGHILPALGDRRVNTITAADVESFRDKMKEGEDGLAAVSVNKVLTTLTAIFDRAVRERYVEANAAKLAERCRKSSAELEDGAEAGVGHLEIDPGEVPTPAEVGKLIEAASSQLFRTYFTAAVMTGARPEELLALPWSNVDLDARAISIRVAVSWARTRADREAKVKGPRFFVPKTKASRRVIPISGELVSALRRWKLACPPSDLNLVFPRQDGSPMHRKELYDKGLLPALAKAELRHFTIYSLRHCFASALALQGRPATEIAYYLGHSSPAITQAIYQHWYPKERTSAVEDLAAAVLGSTTRATA